jgi:hypothetical protein
MRRHLHVADLGEFPEQPLNAILATYRPTGEVLLTLVWHEWRDGGFSAVILAEDAKGRNLQRDPRASILLAEHGGLTRGLEVREIARRIDDEGAVVTRRITQRYLGSGCTDRFVQELAGTKLVHVCLEPGEARAWDFDDKDRSNPEKAGR